MTNSLKHLLTQAQIHQQRGELTAAENLFRQCLAEEQTDPDALYGLGTTFLMRKQPQEALPYLRRAVQALPGVPEFHFNLALTEKQTGNIPAACSSLIEAARSAGQNAQYILPFAKQMLELGLAQEALHFLSLAHPQSLEIAFWKARARGTLGDWAAALEELEQLTKQMPNESSVWREFAKAASYLRDYDRAIAAQEQVVRLNPDDPTGFLGLCDLHLSAHNAAAAQQALNKAFALGAKQAEAYFFAAKCARLAGDYEEMRHHLEKALELRPSYGQAWQALVEIADTKELASIAERCERESTNADDSWDALLLDFAAGRAREKLNQHGDAFAAFARGNNKHKARLAARNALYDSMAVEADTTQLIELFPTYKNNLKSPVSADPTPLFILGMPRSGTTLMEKILSCLEGVSPGGENEAMEFIALQYYWRVKRGEMAKPADLKNASIQEMVHDYWARSPHSDRFITDKMPHNFRHVGLICRLFPTAPVIYMKRHPMDVCLSIYSRLFPDGHRYACDLEWLGHFYAESERLRQHWLTTHSSRVLQINYSELIDDPENITKRAADFCGLEWSKKCLSFHKTTSNSHTFSELQVRKPLNRDGINRWHLYKPELAPLYTVLTQKGVL